MARPPELSQAQLSDVHDPAELLDHAWALEPWGRYVERRATLDALEALLGGGGQPAPPPERDWHLELAAERAVDIGRERDVDGAIALAQRVLDTAGEAQRIARGRAQLALGQALAWVGTEEASTEAHRAFEQAAAIFADIGNRDWQGSALLRRGFSAAYQHGEIVHAEELVRQALDVYPPDSERLAGALAPYADVLIDLGELDRAEEVLDRAAERADRDGVSKAMWEVTFTRARLAAARGDAHATERLLNEADRTAPKHDQTSTHIGVWFLLEAAEMLDRLGLTEQARAYLERGRARAGDDDEEVRQATAVLQARSGDPAQGLEQLQQLMRGDWLEKRLVWRHTLLTAWATFRAGRHGVGELAARALSQADHCGTVRVAVSGEPDLVLALAPLAERAGSVLARELMLAGRPLLVRLFGTASVRTAEGVELALPAGQPGELVRLLALHEHGLPVDAVLETFFPDVAPAVGRTRLRQILKRLRASAGEIVVRDDENLRLLPSWVDLREFLTSAARVRAARGARAVQLAYGALALRDGPLLPNDPYADWAEEAREQVRYRALELLDLVAADAAARGSHQEALTAMEAAFAEDPEGDQRQVAIGEQLAALGRHRTAAYVVRNAL